MKRILPLLLLLCAPLPGLANPSPFGGRPGTPGLLPVKWKSTGKPAATPGTTETRPPAQPDVVAQANPDQPTSAPSSAPASAPTRTNLTPEGGSCEDDEQCVGGTYCLDGQCAKVKRSINILYLYYKSADRRFTEVLGFYWHQKGKSGYRVLVPFYWHLWDEDDDDKVVFPVFWRFTNKKAKTYTVMVPPYQYRKTPKETNYRFWPLVFYTDYGERGSGLTILPFFHRAREGTRTSTIIPLLLSGYNQDPARGYSRGLIAGLYYWHTTPEARAKAVLPLFYHSSARQSSFTWVLPLNFYWRRGKQKNLMLLPLLYHSSHPQRARTISLVPPFYYSRTGDDSRLLVFPLISHRDSPAQSHTVVFPLFWRYSSPGRSTTVAGPVFHGRRGQTTMAGIFPLALYHHDRKEGDKWGLVAPLFFYSSGKHGRNSKFISPLFLYERDDDAKLKHWGMVVPPYYSRRDQEREVDVLFPLFLRWHNRIEQTTTYVAGPLVFYNDPDGGTQVAFPLFWRFTHAKTGAATSILFPLAYRHKRPDGGSFNLFFPFFFNKHPQRWSAGILPLLYAGSGEGRRHAVLFPALWHFSSPEATTTVVGPAYLKTSKKKGWSAGLVPLLFAASNSKRSYQIVFPLLWHMRSHEEQYNTYVAGPAFYSNGRNGRVFGLLPLFAAGTWKGKSFQTVLPPLFYRSMDHKTGKGFTLAGLYYGWREPGVRGHALFPLGFLRFSDKKQQVTAAALPLIYYRKDPKSRLLITPLGGFRQDHEEGVFEGLAGPVAWHRGPTARGFAVIPLLLHYTRPRQQATTTVLLPIGVRHVSPKLTAHVWFPFFWKFTEPKESSLVIFPLYWRTRAEGGVNADVVFPLYWNIRTPERKLMIVGPVFSHKGKETYHAGILPITYYYRNRQGSHLGALPFIYYTNDFVAKKRTWVVGPLYHRRYEKGSATGLLPLFFHKSTPKRKYTVVVPLFWHFAKPEEQTSTTFAGPFFYHRKKDYRSAGLAPLFFTSWDNNGGKTIALAPLFYRRSEIARSALFTPLFGWDRSPDKNLWYAGPYVQKTTKESTLNIFAPLFLRHRNHPQGETSMLALPLYYGNWSAEKSLHVIFPLVVAHRTVDTSATVVLPLFWDFNDKHLSRTTLLFPFFLRHRNHQADSTTYVVPPVLIRDRPDALDVLLFPLVWHFGGQQESTTVALPLFVDVKRNKKRTTVVFPFFWRFDRPGHRTYFVVNTYYRRNKADDTYNFFFLPFVQVARKRPGDIMVEVLGGVGGYERVGKNRWFKLFFVPFELEPTGTKTLSGFGGTSDVCRMDM